ncbi:restriction endonuclease subunit S [Listeria monocytogenes]|uniref:restriction endonuclease subunit S n=1 Tax=Listeria monocytogenes TaxID=1639 RepID=UPI001E5C1D75|nr:restriction endonuclease subunit S [Listeria monocytogenes]MCD2249356.1 restriction endonuclease subunit S [Listeria monocytogenes]
MKKLEKSVPVIRFKGFSEAWEQRKLEELAAFSKGSGYTKNDLVEKGMPLVLYGRLYTKYETIITEVNTFTKMKDKSVISKGNEVVVPSSGETAKDISRASVIGAEGFILGGDLNIIKPKRELNSIFLALTISNGEQQKEIIKRAQGKSVVHVYNTDLKQVKLSYPTFNEQEKIGSFFRQLDNAIALHQRKLDTLKLMKKGFLQQMFPKIEADIPEIRFADFNGNWRQRKLEEVADRVRGNDRRMELPTLTISASKGWLNQHERFFGNIAGKEQKNYTLLKKGQLSYNHGNSKSAKYGAVFVLRTYDEALVPRIYHSFKTNILANSDFIEYLFATKIPDRELRKIISSGARMDGLLNINFNDFMSILIMLPFVEEQIKISNFLIRLDKIISLYQNKLDQLIKLKKAYLQYLFI